MVGRDLLPGQPGPAGAELGSTDGLRWEIGRERRWAGGLEPSPTVRAHGALVARDPAIQLAGESLGDRFAAAQPRSEQPEGAADDDAGADVGACPALPRLPHGLVDERFERPDDRVARVQGAGAATHRLAHQKARSRGLLAGESDGGRDGALQAHAGGWRARALLTCLASCW